MEAARGKSRKIGLVSSAVTDHPDLVALCDHATQAGFKLSFSSLRADRLNETITQAVSGSGVKTATIAPEAGSERMRRIINKNLDETDILSAVRQIVKSGIINLRLYFMVGLPFETDDDANAIAALTLKIKKVFLTESQKQRKIGTITLSINPFIPKPATPFQWAAMSGDAVLKHRVKLIRNALKTTANVRINVESLRKARIHALLSLADRNAADLIEAAAQKGWASVIKTNAAYCKTMIETEKDVLSALPWDFIDNGVKKDFLIQEWERAKAEKTSPACPMTDCTRCGRCR